MYQHILVPLDGTDLSSQTAERAVDFAKHLGAKVTFLYATPDFSATSDGALMIAVSPETYARQAYGDTAIILDEAARVAKQREVPCETANLVSDRPYEAILKVAEEKDCDLIFMASHGHRGLRGLLQGSQTEKVLHHTTIPVLVAAVESNQYATA